MRPQRGDGDVRSTGGPRGEEAADGRRVVHAVSPGGGLRVDLACRDHAWTVDEPADDGGADAGPTPVEALLGALLSCLTISLRFTARRRRVPVERIEGTARANRRGFVTGIAVELHAWSPAPEPEVRALLGPARRGCFVSALLRPDLDYTVALHVHRSPGVR